MVVKWPAGWGKKIKVNNGTKIQNIPFAHERISLSSLKPAKGVRVQGEINILVACIIN